MFPGEAKHIPYRWQRRFPEDEEIDRAVVDLGDVAMFTHPNQFQGWTIEINKIFSPHPPAVTIDRWKALENLAHYLLSSPRD